MDARIRYGEATKKTIGERTARVTVRNASAGVDFEGEVDFGEPASHWRAGRQMAEYPAAAAIYVGARVFWALAEGWTELSFGQAEPQRVALGFLGDPFYAPLDDGWTVQRTSDGYVATSPTPAGEARITATVDEPGRIVRLVREILRSTMSGGEEPHRRAATEIFEIYDFGAAITVHVPSAYVTESPSDLFDEGDDSHGA
jgi:hypothetical protein